MNDHPIKIAGDNVSNLVVVGTVLDKLPSVAAGFAIIWYLIRLYEWGLEKWRGGPKSSDGTDI